MNEIKELNNYKRVENKNTIRALESFFVNGKIENIDKLVELKKEKLVDELAYFSENCVEIKYDKDGNQIKNVNKYLISTYFFKPLNPLTSKIPEYTAEKLAIVWDLYMYLVEQVNIKIAPFNPTLTHFCKFAGITLQTISSYRTSYDEDMRNVVEKIYDETMSGNFEMAQSKMLSEKSTITRLKIENQVVEKAQPNVNINYTEVVDKNMVLDRIDKYSYLIDKKAKKGNKKNEK